MLGLSAQNRAAPRPGQPMPQQTFGAARFLMPVQQCEFQLTGILESLARDPWPVANDKRSLRCTGVAVSVAVGLLEVSYSGSMLSSQTQTPCRRRSPTLVLESWCLPVVPRPKAQGWSSAMSSSSRSGRITISTGIARSTLSVRQRFVMESYGCSQIMIVLSCYHFFVVLRRFGEACVQQRPHR